MLFLRLPLSRLPWLLPLIFAASVAHAQVTAPSITTQPAGKTANTSTAVTFTVAANGTSPSYQWLFNGAPISGATTNSYTLSSVQPANAGAYSVVVSNTAGTVTSGSATLLVYAPYLVRTLAGTSGVQGYGDGAGASASFSHPEGVALDSSGNVYLADTANSVIRKITPAGVVTTLAGKAGVSGSSDGTGTAAQFNFPFGLCVDASGNVFVADTFNSTIRKITPAGVVTTFAGLAPTAANPIPTNQGSTNATGAAARFNTPHGIAVDGAGNLYVADTQNNAVRKITPAGVVTTLAGNPGQNPTFTDGTGSNARFDYPFGITSDSAGNLWVADTSGQIIRSVSPAGVVTTIAGLGGNAGSTGGTGNVARFSGPTAIATDGKGDLFIADENNSTVREILPGNVVVTLAGLAGNVGVADGSGTNARFTNPFGIAVDSSGHVYIADTENGTLRVAGVMPAGDIAPSIVTQPASASLAAGGNATFTVAATGTPNPTYQWQKNGVNIAGAVNATYALTNISVNDSAGYDVVVTNQDGSVTSNTATLNVLAPPVIVPGSQSQTLTAGGALTLNSNATGGNLAYQWYLNGYSIPGATAASLTLTPVGTFEAGTYTVTATNTLGSSSATVATIHVTAAARLMNLSASGPVSGGSTSNALAAGFVTSVASKSILVRGIGPGLSTFGVTSPLAKPVLTLFNSSNTAIGTNSGWSSSLASVFSAVGAFPLAAGSADTALQQTLAAGNYSVNLVGSGSTSGIAMAEIYDADPGANPAGRLINLSARANVGTGSNILTGGFIVSGTSSETVLLRGVGPALAGFGVANALSRPVLSLYGAPNNTLLQSNSGWGGSAEYAALFNLLQAFPLPTSSADAAIVAVLAPGSYTATVSGLNGATGVALVEIYEVPAQ